MSLPGYAGRKTLWSAKTANATPKSTRAERRDPTQPSKERHLAATSVTGAKCACTGGVIGTSARRPSRCRRGSLAGFLISATRGAAPPPRCARDDEHDLWLVRPGLEWHRE